MSFRDSVISSSIFRDTAAEIQMWLYHWLLLKHESLAALAVSHPSKYRVLQIYCKWSVSALFSVKDIWNILPLFHPGADSLKVSLGVSSSQKGININIMANTPTTFLRYIHNIHSQSKPNPTEIKEPLTSCITLFVSNICLLLGWYHNMWMKLLLTVISRINMGRFTVSAIASFCQKRFPFVMLHNSVTIL